MAAHGFEWSPLNNVLVKNQAYYLTTKANWIDSETYAFDAATSTIASGSLRGFAQSALIGDNTDFRWDFAIFRHRQSLCQSTPGQQKLDHFY